MSRLAEFPNPFEQRAKVLAQIATWRERHRKRPIHLLKVQIAALARRSPRPHHCRRTAGLTAQVMTRGKRQTRKAILADLLKNDPAALRSRPAFLSAEWKRNKLLDQIWRWHQKQRRAPSALIETQLTALYRLLDKMDEALEQHDARSRR